MMGGLGVLGWVEVELVVNGGAWAGAQQKDWLAWERVGQLIVRWP